MMVVTTSKGGWVSCSLPACDDVTGSGSVYYITSPIPHFNYARYMKSDAERLAAEIQIKEAGNMGTSVLLYVAWTQRPENYRREYDGKFINLESCMLSPLSPTPSPSTLRMGVTPTLVWRGCLSDSRGRKARVESIGRNHQNLSQQLQSSKLKAPARRRSIHRSLLEAIPQTNHHATYKSRTPPTVPNPYKQQPTWPSQLPNGYPWA